MSVLVIGTFLEFLTGECVFVGMFRTALPSFKALKEFEWIGYPELRDENVDAVLQSHPGLYSLGLM